MLGNRDLFSIPMYNMDISSSKTLLTAVTIGPTLTDIGTWKALSRYPHGKESRFSPFNRESGIILPANEEFYLVIKNSDECSLEISYNFFLREID